jgi:4-hydroxybenzoate polyprenyltransferase
MSLLRQVKEYTELVKFEHSIFALPFALTGMLLATPSHWPAPLTYLWVLLAMIGGRTAAMALNRIIDRDIDRLNPRTKDRAIPAGRIKVSHAIILTVGSLLLMVLAVLQLPVICIYLLPVAILVIIGYSYTKRFTIASHFVLGFVLGSAATGGWLAVSGKLTIPAVLLGLAVILWTAGFDIIYSTQDMTFDAEQNLHSLPAKIGLGPALMVSRLCHLLAVVLLAAIAIFVPLGLFYWLAVFFTGALLFYEHSLISARDLSKVNVAFFNINGFVSIGILIFIMLDKVFN